MADQGIRMIQAFAELGGSGKLPSPNTKCSGVVTDVTAYVVDANAKFITDGVEPGDVFSLTSVQIATVVKEVVSETELILDISIAATNDEYRINPTIGPEGCMMLISYGNSFSGLIVETVGGDTINLSPIQDQSSIPVRIKKAYIEQSYVYGTYVVV